MKKEKDENVTVLKIPNLMIEDVTFEDVVDNRELILKLFYEVERIKKRRKLKR
jgi:hypothetical protein